MIVDKIFIICLSQNIDRKKQLFLDRLKIMTIFEQVPFEIIEAVDGTKINSPGCDDFSLYPNWPIESTNSWWSRAMKVGEIGCSLSHWRVWQKAKQENLSRILVLEEDFLPNIGDWNLLAKIPEPWDFLYLGRMPQAKDEQLLQDGFCLPGFSYQSHAYMLSKSGLSKLLESGFVDAIIPIDEFFPVLYGQNPREDLKLLYKNRIKALATNNDMIMQDKQEPSTTEKVEYFNNENYKPLHPQLYDAFGTSVENWVNKYVNLQLVHGEFDLICDEPVDNILIFPVFNSIFCKELIEEAEHFGQWQSDRHKKYPTNDMLLNAFGFDMIYNFVIKKYVMPLLLHKYKLDDYWMNAKIENFIARYRADVQQHLGIHHDGSYLSLILTLNTEFKGGGTYFPKFKTLIKPETAGYMSCHPGMVGFQHGARPITEGKRYIVASFISER